ncbi:alpha/beta hydrolase [Paenibacillus thalictri]|uniref:Alpha/beta fold hydrolase n=1 Tax=Paenibacillus thalictri TaxID=2527873 RepID=A0A4Q9DIB9_9BACL|nr:alpha/beta fold hydrolase [Paenibacillus thalictri]TBL71031.1 alpha/beta fold hydrolase [Paenibacillus thalictri]
MAPIVIVIVSAVLALCLLSIGIAAFVGWSLTHPQRSPLTETPDHYGIAYENVQFPSRRHDVSLQGWYLAGAEPRSRMTVVMAHGYRENRLQSPSQALPLAQFLVKQGYDVLMFDFRNSGNSEGNVTSVGYFEKSDLLGAMDWVKTKKPEGIIGIIGFSMGATTALMAAAEEPSVAGIVADSPFSQLKPYLQENLPVWSHLPNFPFTPLILNIIPPLTGIDPEQVDAIKAADALYPRPALFIHSVNDHSIPISNSEAIASRHPDKFELWKTENEGHVRSHPAAPEAYETKVADFLGKLSQ